MATNKKIDQEVSGEDRPHYLGPWLSRTKTKSAALARHLGRSPSAISKWVSYEREPTLDELRRAAEFMDIGFTAIFFHPDDEGARARANRMDDEVLDAVMRSKLG